MCACIDTRAVAAYEDVKGTRLETALGRKPLTLLLFRARSHHTRSAICCAIVPVEKYAAAGFRFVKRRGTRDIAM